MVRIIFMENNDTKMTPMVRQYLEIKKNYKDAILFFRLGDFYEMFFDDAKKASRILDIVLTKRQSDIPMCGIPFHSSDNYISRLIKAGEKVAICEQLEAVPSTGTIVKRDVIRVITPGTVVETNLLQSDDNNFLSSAVIKNGRMGLSFIDISTGDFFVTEMPESFETLVNEFARFNPSEVLFKSFLDNNDRYINFFKMKNISCTAINEWLYDHEYLSTAIKEFFQLVNIKGLPVKSDIEILSAGSILEYIKDTQKKSVNHIKFPKKIVEKNYMALDDAAINNLELIYNTTDKTKNKTLFSLLNNTRTAMGKRLLERNILNPLVNIDELKFRLSAVSVFYENQSLLKSAGDILRNIQDLERLISRFSIGKVFPREFIAVANSLEQAAVLKDNFRGISCDYLHDMIINIPDLSVLSEMIGAAITEEPAVSPENGRVIKQGFNADIDRLHEIKTHSKEWVVAYQEDEKIRLDIPTLKIRYNRIFGYYIEISKAQSVKAPADYLRKQTLVNAERFTTEKLQKFETEALSAEDKIIELENAELEKLRLSILEKKDLIQLTAAVIAEVDYYYSLAVAAVENNYVRPDIHAGKKMFVKNGRHPIVEKYYTKEVFIPNDINFDDKENIIKIITGPNMAGKSTYIRMAAVIQLLGQIGSFVPADEAILPVVDRIFTRIGASDNISRGESTFLVEMNETAAILNNATDKSLIIMDEVGRGTATYDGYSIAHSIVEYILQYIKAKTLFATHYHELTALEEKFSGVVNYTVLVNEKISGIDFLHKIVRGSADKSYGIYVAKLAGIPKQVTSRAQKILDKIEKKSRTVSAAKEADTAHDQTDLFNAANHRIIQILKQIEIEKMSPIEALNEINRLKNMIDD